MATARIAAFAPAALEAVERHLNARGDELSELMARAAAIRDRRLERIGRARMITYSRKVFIPVTTLCRDRCHYCTFVDTPNQARRKGTPLYMSPDQVLAVAHQGARLGCKEALFTLGDRPEDRWPEAADWLAEHGFSSTLDYVEHLARRVLDETGLLPHLNPGVMSRAELERLRPVAPSMGMMLETTSRDLWATPGRAHYGSPDKDPELRLGVLEDAGDAAIPFTTGLLIGIGESLRDRAESILALAGIAARGGHIQEVIVQNFRAKPGTAMRDEPDAEWDRYLAAIAATRIAVGPDVGIQAPPNLADPDGVDDLLDAGIDDWGGVSPLTPDHVNPERPWPEIRKLEERTRARGFELAERLTAHPAYVHDPDRWFDPAVATHVHRLAEPGTGLAIPGPVAPPRPAAEWAVHVDGTRAALRAAETAPERLTSGQLAALLVVEGDELERLLRAADDVRRYSSGDVVTYVPNRSIMSSRYAGAARAARDAFDAEQLGEIAREARAAGVVELCLQGAPPPEAGADPYVEMVRAITGAVREMHVHAFRAGELLDGAARTGEPLEEYLARLRDAGLGSVTGTGVRVDGASPIGSAAARMLSLDEWTPVMRAAHRAGLRSTAVLLYGAGERAEQRVDFLQRLKRMQHDSGGFTECIPMPAGDEVGRLVPSRSAREEHGAMTAVARLALVGAIRHVQAAWPRLGDADAVAALQAGADDLGGTLYDGEVHPHAGAQAGVVRTPDQLARLARAAGRQSDARTTGYDRIAVPA